MSDQTKQTGRLESGRATGSAALWIVAVLLFRRNRAGSITPAQSISWRYGVTEDEARGEAVRVAMEKLPQFTIEMVSVVREDRLSPNSGTVRPCADE